LRQPAFRAALLCNNAFMIERPQTLGEEIANSVSHGLALLAALVAAPF
jgi:hemolysin III